MNKIRVIGIIVASLFIIAIGISEIATSSIFLNRTLNEANEILNIANEDNFTSLEISVLTEKLKEKWTKREKILCFLVNHKDIEEIGEKLNIMLSSIKDEDWVNYNENLGLVIYYCNAYKHIFSLTPQNIF